MLRQDSLDLRHTFHRLTEVYEVFHKKLGFPVENCPGLVCPLIRSYK